ncbi:MAG TPA: TlpA disulfide reductase family protein [Puia sp.]
MQKVIIAFIGLACLSLAACHSSESGKGKHAPKDSSYVILGKITGQDTGTVYLQHRDFSETIDSTKLDHSYFTFKGKADSVEYCYLGILAEGKKQFRTSFFLQNGKMTVLAKKDSLENALISGAPVQDEYNDYQNAIEKGIGIRSAALDKKYSVALAKGDKKTTDSLEKEYDALDMEQKKMVSGYVKAHPASYISAFEIAQNFSYNPDPDQLDSLYKNLDPAIQSTYFGRMVNNTLKKARLTAIGQPAPDFTSTATDGKEVSLSSFRGRYVLVDFWASWCGPCRRENPAVVKAYHQFHPKGFDILGVSLDNSKTSWEEAIKKDGLNWAQVSDLRGWKNDVASRYGIQGIPMNFLLDKEGRIIAKGLRGEDLTKKLAEVIH